MLLQQVAKLSQDIAAPEALQPMLTAAPVVTGLVAGTLVEGSKGWHPIETFRVGDSVQTLDGGLARILAMDRRQLLPAAENALILVPGGTHDACDDLLLVPGQHVLIDTLDDAEIGAPFAMVPAMALTTDRLVRRMFPHKPVEIVTPLFADEEVVYANSGVLVHCPGLMDGAGRYPENSFFLRLNMTDARAFLKRRAERLAA